MPWPVLATGSRYEEEERPRETIEYYAGAELDHEEAASLGDHDLGELSREDVERCNLMVSPKQRLKEPSPDPFDDFDLGNLTTEEVIQYNEIAPPGQKLRRSPSISSESHGTLPQLLVSIVCQLTFTQMNIHAKPWSYPR